jgi:hypothetical protein
MNNISNMFENLNLNDGRDTQRKSKNNKLDESFEEIIESFFDLTVKEKPDEYKLLLTCLKCSLFDYSQYIKELTVERYKRYIKYIKLDEFLIKHIELYLVRPDFCLMKEIDTYILSQIE